LQQRLLLLANCFLDKKQKKKKAHPLAAAAFVDEAAQALVGKVHWQISCFVVVLLEVFGPVQTDQEVPHQKKL
jgi:hypothetical protein